VFRELKLEVVCGSCGRKNRVHSERLVLQKAVCGKCHAGLEDEAERLSLERGFGRVLQELDRLRARIYQIDGVWIFRFHRYTVEELLQSRHAQQVLSITEKIGSDIGYWVREQRLGKLTLATYIAKRESVFAKLDKLIDEVILRKPTKWEITKTLLRHFLKIVLGNLPDFARRELPPARQGLLGRSSG
jgi:hypothetical protein